VKLNFKCDDEEFKSRTIMTSSEAQAGRVVCLLCLYVDYASKNEQAAFTSLNGRYSGYVVANASAFTFIFLEW